MKRHSLLVLLIVAAICVGEHAKASEIRERTWRVQYFGGAIGAPGKIERWNNILTVSSEQIALQLYKHPLIEIDPGQVTAVGYSRKVMYREGTAAALGMVAPALGLAVYYAARSRSHYVAIEFVTKEGVKTGVLLRVDKKDYGEIVESLKSVVKLTGSAEIEQSKKQP